VLSSADDGSCIPALDRSVKHARLRVTRPQAAASDDRSSVTGIGPFVDGGMAQI
jgi:hypothetical protein